jgi:protein involved in polysaccharide export with SLBB domain
MRWRGDRCGALLAAATLGVWMAASDVQAQTDAVPRPWDAAAAAALYRVARGDELQLRFLYTPELNLNVVVRSDGRVSLPLVGDVLVEGLTVPALTERVQRQLAEQVRRPQVVINIGPSSSQRVFVGGEVQRPGVQPLIGPLTVLQAVMAAEGLRDSAQPAEVLVLRRGPPGTPSEVLRVDLAQLLAGAAGASDPMLMPYDVIVVPRSGIASVGLWVDQYLRRTLPFSLGFTYNLNRNATLQ